MSTAVKRRPIRGALAGFLLGLGATLMMILADVPVPATLCSSAAWSWGC
ncbi:MAG TPA: hypothetical protein VLQ92_03580 [Candidatus Limnocylindrales bacterium]|nr:hypothetical protein [Candidatus Limnocylindrales bacterium]